MIAGTSRTVVGLVLCKGRQLMRRLVCMKMKQPLCAIARSPCGGRGPLCNNYPWATHHVQPAPTLRGRCSLQRRIARLRGFPLLLAGALRRASIMRVSAEVHCQQATLATHYSVTRHTELPLGTEVGCARDGSVRVSAEKWGLVDRPRGAGSLPAQQQPCRQCSIRPPS
jgi:hypothetical protein